MGPARHASADTWNSGTWITIGVLGVGLLVRATDPAAPPVTIRRANLKMAAKHGRDARRLPLSHSWQCRFGYATSQSTENPIYRPLIVVCHVLLVSSPNQANNRPRRHDD